SRALIKLEKSRVAFVREIHPDTGPFATLYEYGFVAFRRFACKLRHVGKPELGCNHLADLFAVSFVEIGIRPALDVALNLNCTVSGILINARLEKGNAHGLLTFRNT